MSYYSDKSYSCSKDCSSSNDYIIFANNNTKTPLKLELLNKLEQYADDPIMVKIIAQQLRSIK